MCSHQPIGPNKGEKSEEKKLQLQYVRVRSRLAFFFVIYLERISGLFEMFELSFIFTGEE